MIPATFREVRKYVRGDVQPEIVVQAASRLRMKASKSSREFMTFTVRLNFSSYGERVTVALGSVDGCTLVDVTSSCVFPLQIADWGKNERNVRRLFDGIDEMLGDGYEHVQCLLCRGCGYLLVEIPAGICPECGREHSASDGPGKQESATLKNTIALAAGITAVELALVYLLNLSGAGGFLSEVANGVRGAVNLLLFNLVVLLGIVGLHRLATRYARRL